MSCSFRSARLVSFEEILSPLDVVLKNAFTVEVRGEKQHRHCEAARPKQSREEQLEKNGSPRRLQRFAMIYLRFVSFRLKALFNKIYILHIIYFLRLS